MTKDFSPWNPMFRYAVEVSSSASAKKKLATAQKKISEPSTYQELAEAASEERYLLFTVSTH
jgi:hypothetical protein